MPVSPGVILAQTRLTASVNGPTTVPAALLTATLTADFASFAIVEAGVLAGGILEDLDSVIVPVLDGGTVDDSMIDNVLPRDEGRRQLIGRPVVEIDGTELDLGMIADGFSVTERIDGAKAFQFSVPDSSDFETDGASTAFQHPLDPNFDDPINSFLGAAPGKSTIDIYWMIPSAAGFQKIKLIHNGIAMGVQEATTTEGRVTVVSGTGWEQRVDRQKIDLVLPPGHGLSLGETVRKILVEVPGIDDADIPPFNPGATDFPVAPNRYKEVIISDQEGWGMANELLGLYNYRVQMNRDGDLALSYQASTAGVEPDWTLSLSDILAESGLGLTASNEGPTAARVVGSSQVVDPGDGGDGQSSAVQTVQIFNYDHLQRWPKWRSKDTAGTLQKDRADYYPNVTGPYWWTGFEWREFPYLGLGQEIKVYRTKWFDAPLTERVETWRYDYEAHRNRCNVTLQSDGSYVWPVDTSQYRDPNGRASTWLYRGWRRWEYQETNWTYEPHEATGTSYLVRKETRHYGQYAERRPIATWNSSNGEWDFGTHGTSCYWDGQPSTWLYEFTQEIKREIWTYDVNDDLLVTGERYENWEWSALPGSRYLWVGGFQSSNSFEILRMKNGEQVYYTEDGASGHSKTIQVLDYGGSITGFRVESGEGYLPAAEVVDTGSQNLDPDEFPDAVPASRQESEEWEVSFNSAALATHRQDHEATLSSPWLENEEEGLAFATHHVKESSTVAVSMTVALNPLIRAGQKVRINAGKKHGAAKSDVYDVTIEEITNEQVAGVGLTHMMGKRYVI